MGAPGRKAQSQVDCVVSTDAGSETPGAVAGGRLSAAYPSPGGTPTMAVPW